MSQSIVQLHEQPAETDDIVAAIDCELEALRGARDALREKLSPIEMRIGALVRSRDALVPSTRRARPGPSDGAMPFGGKRSMIISIVMEARRPLHTKEVAEIAPTRGYKQKCRNEIATMLGFAARKGKLRCVSRGLYEAV